jgi:hypothetical protein
VETYVLAGVLTNFFRARIQVDVWAEDDGATDPYATARAGGQAINDALAGQAFIVGDGASPESFVDVTSIQLIDRAVDYVAEELRLVRVRQDYAVVFRQVTA